MPLTAIDLRPALIVVDLQRGVVAMPVAHPIDDVVQNSASLAAAFRSRGFPVVLVNADARAPGRTDADQSGQSNQASFPRSPDWTELVEELDAQPSDVLITKQRWGAFHGTTLDEQLRDVGVTQVMITGVATSAGVESTARQAHELGYHVVLATDAMTDSRADAHLNSVERVFPRIGETTTTGEILRRLNDPA